MLPRNLKHQFILAIRDVLRPIVRQLIAYGIPYQVFDGLVREVYLDVAEEEFRLPYKRQTDSRLSLMTGLNRKEIAHLRERKPTRSEVTPAADTTLTHVIGRWMAGPPYATPDGHARRIAYESSQRNQPSFANLVHEAGADVPVRSVLDELMRIGAVELLPDGDVALRTEAHIPPAAAEAKLALLGTDPGELFRTIVHNVEHPDAPRLQRKVMYDNVGTEALQALNAEARRLGEDFIRRANALLASYDRDRNRNAPGGKRHRVVLGAYYFEDEQRDPTAPPDVPPPDASRARPPGRIRKSPGRARRSR